MFFRQLGVQPSHFLFAEVISIFIQNRTIGQNFYRQNIIFHHRRIIKFAFASKKLAQMLQHIVVYLTLGRFKSRIHHRQTLLVVPCGNSPLANRIKENAEAAMIHFKSASDATSL